MDTPWQNLCVIDLELHSHTRYSRDSLSTLDAVIRRCREAGIHRIAITDHNSVEGALRARDLAPDLVIVGEEVMTTQGELLCLFLQRRIPPHLAPESVCDEVHAQGGVLGPSHPCDTRRSGLGVASTRALAHKLDFIETFNSRTRNPLHNHEAAALAAELGLPKIAASDAHSPGEIGCSRTRVAAPFSTPADFLAQIKNAELVMNSSPARVLLRSSGATLVRALGMARPPREQ